MGNEQSFEGNHDVRVDIVLHLNDIRNIPAFDFGSGDRVFALIFKRGERPMRLTLDRPAVIPVRLNDILRIAFYKQRQIDKNSSSYGSTYSYNQNNSQVLSQEVRDGEASGVGQIVISIESLARSRLILYHTWLLIDPNMSENPYEEDQCFYDGLFTKSIMEVGRLHYLPKACLTIFRNGDHELTQKGVFSVENVSRELKAQRYECLLQSHNQHLQMSVQMYQRLQECTSQAHIKRKEEKTEDYKNQIKALQKESDYLRKKVDELQRRHQQDRVVEREKISCYEDKISMMENPDFMSQHKLKREEDKWTEEMEERLRQEIENVTSTANQRIDSANDRIIYLKQLDQENKNRLNEQEKIITDKEKELLSISKQKDTLMKIVESLYHRTGEGESSGGSTGIFGFSDGTSTTGPIGSVAYR